MACTPPNAVHFKFLIAKFSEKPIALARKIIAAHELPEQALIQPSAIYIEEILGKSSGRGNESHYIPLEKS